MATRKINTCIEHLVNENLAATQAAVTAGAAVKQKKREQRDDAIRSALGGAGIGSIARDSYKHLMPKIGDVVDIASPTQAQGKHGDAALRAAAALPSPMEKALKRAKDKLKQKTPPSGSMVGY